MIRKVIKAIRWGDAELVLRFDGQQLHLERGKISQSARTSAARLLLGANAKKGEILMSDEGKISIKGKISTSLHQQLRNIILSGL